MSQSTYHLSMHTVFFVFICSEGGKLYIPLVLVNDNFFWVGGRAVGGRDFFYKA